METLKRVLTVMVVTLVLIIVVGGVYTFGMGNMNHGTGGQMNMTTAQNGSANDTKQDQSTKNNDTASKQDTMPGMNMETGSSDQASQGHSMNADDSGETGKAQQPSSQQQQNNQSPPPAGVPVIIQAPPDPKTDPRLYVEQLKEKVKQINEANAQIAANSGGQVMAMQPSGSGVSTDQSKMNELHQGFYKLGQTVSAMEQTLDNLSQSVQAPNAGTPYYYGTQYYYGAPQGSQYPGQPQAPYYPYGYPQNYPQNNPNAQYNNNQMSHSGQNADQTGGMNSNMQMDPNMQMNSNTQMNHSGLNISGLFNANNIKLVFSLILLGSLILGIVAVVGFISSLFKPKKVTQDSAQL